MKRVAALNLHQSLISFSAQWQSEIRPYEVIVAYDQMCHYVAIQLVDHNQYMLHVTIFSERSKAITAVF